MANIIGNYNGLPQYPSYHNPQVHSLVYDENGASRSHIDRAYISFNYAGKDIEEFGLIAVFEDNGKTGSVYANFEDITSSYQMVDGQFYWGTHFTNNTLNFTLATDGMTQNQIDAFKRHFRPGQSATELILSEHSNRAILARVSAPPTYQLVPFRKKESTKISWNLLEENYKAELNAKIENYGHWTIIEGTSLIPTQYIWESYNQEYDYWGYTEDSVYNQILNDPIWGLLPEHDITIYKGTIQLSFIMDNPFWYSKESKITGELTNDNLKIIIEDNIPYGELLTNCFIGGRTYSNAPTTEDNNIYWNNIKSILNTINAYNITDTNDLEGILEQLVSAADVGLTVPDIGSTIKLFNSGTAPANPILAFKLYPQIDNSAGYICKPWNIYCTTSNANITYNTISLQKGTESIVFKFSIPSAYIGFNQAIQLATGMNGQSKVAVEEAMRNGIKEYYSRAWAIHCVESQQNSNFSFSLFKTEMKKFISDDNNNYYPATFVFNSATGEAIGGIGVRTTTSTAAGTIIKENVGDMVKSKYLTIEENNHLVNGQIGTDYYTVTTDYPDGLTNVLILFNNMYY